MSYKMKGLVNELLQKAKSDDDSLAYEALMELEKIPGLLEHIPDAAWMGSLKGISRKHGKNVIGDLASRLFNKWKYSRTHRNHLCDSTKTNEHEVHHGDVSYSHSGRQDYERPSLNVKTVHSFNEVDQTRHWPNHLERVKKSTSKSNHIQSDAKQIEASHESSHGKRQKTLPSSMVGSEKVSPLSHLPSSSGSRFFKTPEKKDERLSKRAGFTASTEKEHSSLFKKDVRKTLPSDSKNSFAQSQKHSSNSKFNTSMNSDTYSRKNTNNNNILRENLSRMSQASNDDIQVNGFSDEDHSNSFQNYAASQVVNGHSHLETKQSFSRESSHLHGKKHCGPEGNDQSLTFHKRIPSHGRDSNSKKSHAPVKLDFMKSYEKCHSVSQCSPGGRDLSTSSHKRANRSPYPPYRPYHSASNPNEYSNEDRPLPDESRHLMIDNTDNCGTTNSEQSTKAPSPYSVQLKEGMFRTVKVGPEQDVLKVREVKHFGSGGLEDGAFSWGWSIERRGPCLYSSKSSSSSKEKSPATALRDTNKCKRRIDYDKIDHPAPPLKKHQSSKDLNRREEKDFISNGRDAESNREQCIDEEKEVKRTSGMTDKPKYPHSPVARKISPNQMPSCDGNGRIPKVDCDAKSSKVIDDATMGFILSKKDRRSTVYSGRRTAHEIPPLKCICSEYVKKNILCIKIAESVPFERLQPILEQCSPSKLHKIEEQNKHLLKYTNCIWEKFCKIFRDQRPVEGQSWKDVYWRALNKREKKLKSLTASISNGMAKAPTERQAKWMGVDSRDPEKRQRKIKLDEPPPPPKPELNGRGSGLGNKSSGSESSSSPQPVQKAYKISKPVKKTVAPLMSKTKKMLNLVNRRR